MNIESIFFELLQVAICTRETFSVQPTSREWTLLFEMSKKQALTAIAFAGVNRLRGDGDFGASLGIPEVLYLKWLGLTAKIQRRNQELNAECAKVCREFAHDGVQSVVLKGQSNLVYYPEHLREARTAGDIDLWCSVPEGVEVAHEVGGSTGSPTGVEKREYRGMEGVIEYCKQYERCQGREIPWHRVLYYHCELTSPEGIGIEPHYRPTYLCSPLRNWRLQRWFRENEQWGLCDAAVGGDKTKTGKTAEVSSEDPSSPLANGQSSEIVSKLPSSAAHPSATPSAMNDTSAKNKKNLSFPVPTVSFNAIYQLLHIYKHLFEGGIGLRQLLDYYFVLRALHIEQGELADRTESMAQWAEGMGIAVKSNEEIMHVLGRLGMRKFASAVMYVLAQVFEPSHDNDTANAYDNDNWASRWPWMICEPDEKEGKFLLNEIMMAGNFGKYDERIRHGGSQFSHAIEKTKHNLRLLTHYPEEVIWEPVFRVYHYFWRKFSLWRY